MPVFQYKAKKKSAETVLGQILAETKEDAVEKIHHLELVPIVVEEQNRSSADARGIARGVVGKKDVYVFSRQMMNLLKAGVPILRGLELVAVQFKNAYFRSVLGEVQHGIREGKTFSACLSEYPKIFSPLYVTMVKAGEESGRLKEIFIDITEYLRVEGEFSAKVRTAMAYPILMGVFGVGTVIFILMQVMPKISGLFINLGQTLPAPTVFVMNVSRFLVQWWWALAGATIMGVGIFNRWRVSKTGRLVISQIKLTMPGLGSFWMKVELTRFCRTLQLLLKSGISIVRAIQLSVPVVDNQLIQDQLRKCQDDLIAGRSFSESLKQTRLIPEIIGQLITVGEESGSLGETLNDIAESYEQETEEALKVMVTLLEPMMILAVGSVVGFIVIAMLLPIFQLDVFAQ